MRKTAFIYSDEFLKHDTGFGHVERPQRLSSVIAHLRRTELWDCLRHFTPASADMDVVSFVHPYPYITKIQKACKNGLHYLDSDTVVCEQSYRVALLAAGSTIEAAQVVVSGEADNAFCAVRPPGHHAEPERAMGFCLFNNVAIVARWLQKKAACERVAIVDWDVHHGNGTQAAFYDDPSVFYTSIHQHPFYPGTGSADEIGCGEGRGSTLNIPVPAGLHDADYLEHFQTTIIPALNNFSPDFILISAGFDAHRRDPLGQMRLSAPGFARLTELVVTQASKQCEGRLVSILEGGYDLGGLCESVEAHLRELIGL